MSHEYTSAEMASLAARAMSKPESLTLDEIQSLAASALSQARDKKEPESYVTVEEATEFLTQDAFIVPPADESE